MQLAIKKAEEGIKKGQTPFGACIVKNDKVITTAHNTVWQNTDITCHAEINAIKSACKELNSINLSGCTIYSTCEPCSMCFSACHWAGISKIIYGTSIEDARKIGFNELAVSNKIMKQLSRSSIKIEGGILKKECLELFKLWSDREDKKTY